MVKIVKNLTLNISTFASLVFSQNVINIDYSLKAGGFEILTNFINDSVWTNVFLQHGCWCAKLNPNLSSTGLGGRTPADELDTICKQWAQSRGCTKLPGVSWHIYVVELLHGGLASLVENHGFQVQKG